MDLLTRGYGEKTYVKVVDIQRWIQKAAFDTLKNGDKTLSEILEKMSINLNQLKD